MGYTPHVLVVGGSPVGAGTARDLAIRGLEVTLVDAGSLAEPRVGRTGRLLASGAQFAREDPGYARRCLEENRTLSEIASHCIDETGGLVLTDRPEALTDACERCGITARVLSGEEAREREPALDPDVTGAVAAPDAAIDPALLSVSLVRDAHEYGADIRPRTTVTDVRVENGAVDGVTLRHDPRPSALRGSGRSEDGRSDDADETNAGEEADEANTDSSDEDDDARTDGGAKQIPGMASERSKGKETPGAKKTNQRPGETVEELDVDYVVNAAGAAASDVAELAACSLPGSHVQAPRLVATTDLETVLTRPTDGRPDSFVPVGGQLVVEPGDGEAPLRSHGEEESTERGEPVDPDPAPAAVDAVCAELLDGAGEFPAVADDELLWAEPAVRYEREFGDGRDFAVLDHGKHHDCWGLLSVVGGTVTTHRWVAEKICDRICEAFGIRRECRTAELVLHGGERPPPSGERFGLTRQVYERSSRRLASATAAVLDTDGENPVVCECRSVTRAEIQAALADETTSPADLGGVRLRTSAATGECQGARCAHRLAAELSPAYADDVVEGACADLLDERWARQRPVAGRLGAMARTYRLHAGVMNRAGDPAAFDSETRSGFADGRDQESETVTCCPRPGDGWER